MNQPLDLDPIDRRARIASTIGELVTVTRQDVPALIAEVLRLRAENAELAAQRERRRARLVALQNDALDMRGSLSPNGEDPKVPFPLGETLTPAVDWLISRVAGLEQQLAEAQAATETNREVARVLFDELAAHRPA